MQEPWDVPALSGWVELVEYAGSAPGDVSLAGTDDAALEQQVLAAAAEMAASTGRWLRLLREALIRGVWAVEGARTPADWLAYVVGMAPSTAREHCRVALRLAYFPMVGQRLEAGTLSYSKARAITRVHDARLEGLLLDYADQATGAQLERIVAGFGRSTTDEGTGEDVPPAWERVRFEAVELDPELTEIRIVVPTVAGERFLAAVDDRATRARTAARRAARASGEVPDPRPADLDRVEAVLAAGDLLAEAGPVDVSGTDRTLLVIHADAEQFADAPARDRTEPVTTIAGPRRRRERGMSARTLRRLACTARYALVGESVDGGPVGVSGTTRRVPARLRRALLARDGTCRFPSCHATVGLHAHHVVEVSDGGPTVLDNLMTLCAYHHTFVHERGWVIRHDGTGRARFEPPGGAPLPTARRLRGRPDSAESARSRPADPDRLRARGVDPPDYHSCVDILHQHLRLLEPPEAVQAA